MSYLVNRHRGAKVTVNGVDRTSNLESISISDSSVRAGGLIVTSGSLTFRRTMGSPSIADYTRTTFKRGQIVIIDIKNPNDTYTRHPRGYLYVVQSIYNPEEDRVEIEVGCRLYMASISDEVDNLMYLTSLTIEDDQKSFDTLSKAIETECNIAYQNNQGSIVLTKFFGTDGINTIQGGEWLSIFGQTALAVGPVGSSSVVPDVIKLTYNTTDTEGTETDPPKIDTVETYSDYYIVYPATIWERKRPEDGLSGVGGAGNTNEINNEPRTSDSCGGTSDIAPPDVEEETESCSEGYGSEPTKQASAVSSTEISTTYYEGPGNAVSLVETEKYGPAVELNSQYYSDLYGFCVWGYSTQCNPSGNCPQPGLTSVKQGYSTTTYTYGDGGEVIKQVVDTYANKLKAAKEIDWRSGLKQTGSVLEYSNFDTISENEFYLATRVTTDYEYYENSTIETTTTQTSPADGPSGVGIRAGVSIDATSGQTTTVRRISSTTGGPEQPDASTGSTQDAITVENTIEDVRPFVGYVDPPTETNPVILEMQIMTTLGTGGSTIASQYLSYYRRMLEAESTGLRIAEGLRDDIVTNWRPGMPFRYYDPRINQVFALRMDACSWVMDADESIVATDAMMIGETNGTVTTLPANLVGNETRPTLDTPIAVFTGSISGNILTVTGVTTGSIIVNGLISVDGVPSGIYIQSFLTGTGGTGTYQLNQSLTSIPSSVIYIFSSVTPGQVIPIVEDETGLTNSSFSLLITINFYLQVVFSTGGGDNGYGIITPPPTVYVDVFQTWVCFISGGLYAPGSIMATLPNGGVPLSNGNVLLTSSPVLVDADFFA